MTVLRRLVRAEVYKLRTTPGPWVCIGAAVLLTGLGITTSFLIGTNGHVHFTAPTTVAQLRSLVGAGYEAGVVLAPIIGVICITSEYRHKVLTATLLLNPKRGQVISSKIAASMLWALLACAATFALIACMGIPLLVSQGGSPSALLDQVGPVVPGIVVAYALLAVYGMGIGTLVRNQIAGVLLALGISLVLEPIIVAIFGSLVHIDVNFLPSRATQALAGGLNPDVGATGTGGPLLLSWWLGGIALVCWGFGLSILGYLTTFRRDVT